MIVTRMKRIIHNFNETTPTFDKILAGVFWLVIACIVVTTLYHVAEEKYTEYEEAHPSPGEHLRRAKLTCPHTETFRFNCFGPNLDFAISHLEQIPSTAPEYAEASKMLSGLIEWRKERLSAVQEAIAQKRLERDRIANQSETESRQQMLRNIAGEARDTFTCSTSTENTPIMSFNYGHYWWPDDGRCAAEDAQRQEAEKRAHDEAQKRRDEDAQIYSYWPTTIRIDTDMDSSWLPDEERTCQTYPDDKGRIAIVACTSGGSHREHNIPVRFWGGVDRNKVSDWKCRRESDQFVCRAID